MHLKSFNFNMAICKKKLIIYKKFKIFIKSIIYLHRDLESNRISYIHPDAFQSISHIEDL